MKSKNGQVYPWKGLLQEKYTQYVEMHINIHRATLLGVLVKSNVIQYSRSAINSVL